MPKRTIEHANEAVLSPRDIWNQCKNLQPGEWLDKLFYLAATDTRGNTVPILVKVGTSTETHDSSKLIFLFRIDDDNVFAAGVTHRSHTDPHDIEFVNTYTYQELRPAMKKLAGTHRGELGFVEIPIEKRPAQREHITPPADTPLPTAVHTSFETGQERRERMNRIAFRTYIQQINQARSAPHFEQTVYGIIEKQYNLKEKLTKKIASAMSSDAREYWGEPPVELRVSNALLFDDRPHTIEEAVERVQKTLTIRILYGTYPATTPDDIVPLHTKHIQALAAFQEDLKNLDTPHSLLKARLQKAGFKQVRLELAANVEHAGEMEYRVIRLDDFKVPEI